MTKWLQAAGAVQSVVVAKTALEFCVSLSQEAVDRFQQQAGLVLNHWKLTRGKDLGAILFGLVRSGVFSVPAEGDVKLLQELSMMEGPFVVAV